MDSSGFFFADLDVNPYPYSRAIDDVSFRNFIHANQSDVSNMVQFWMGGKAKKMNIYHTGDHVDCRFPLQKRARKKTK